MVENKPISKKIEITTFVPKRNSKTFSSRRYNKSQITHTTANVSHTSYFLDEDRMEQYKLLTRVMARRSRKLKSLYLKHWLFIN